MRRLVLASLLAAAATAPTATAFTGKEHVYRRSVPSAARITWRSQPIGKNDNVALAAWVDGDRADLVGQRGLTADYYSDGVLVRFHCRARAGRCRLIVTNTDDVTHHVTVKIEGVTTA